MSDTTNYGFGRFVPGFDFLQNIAKGASKGAQVPSITNWVAPTLNVEELEKRISELKAVHFWLDQNSKALGATIQALEVQKMTLATLKGMNFSMGELANALKLKPAEASKPAKDAGVVGKPEPKARGDGEAGAAAVDPLQWWGSLTHQFQEIASNAMKDVAQKNAMDAAKNMATGVTGKAGKAVKAAEAGTTKAAKKPARKKAPTRKT